MTLGDIVASVMSSQEAATTNPKPQPSPSPTPSPPANDNEEEEAHEPEHEHEEEEEEDAVVTTAVPAKKEEGVVPAPEPVGAPAEAGPAGGVDGDDDAPVAMEEEAEPPLVANTATEEQEHQDGEVEGEGGDRDGRVRREQASEHVTVDPGGREEGGRKGWTRR